MQINVKSYSSKSSLISSIIFFIIGAILTAYSDQIMNTVYYIIGGVLLLTGVTNIIIILIQKKKNEEIFLNRIAFIIITLMLSVLFFFFHSIIDESIRFIIGAWVLFSGVLRLISALRTNNKASRFFALIIISLIQIGLGIFTIIKNGILPWIVGIVLMLYAFFDIVGYIFYSKDVQDFEEEKKDLLITENNDSKKDIKKLKHNKTIKDVDEKDIETK